MTKPRAPPETDADRRKRRTSGRARLILGCVLCMCGGIAIWSAADTQVDPLENAVHTLHIARVTGEYGFFCFVIILGVFCILSGRSRMRS